MGYTIKDIDSGKLGERQTVAMRATFADDGVDVAFPTLPAGTIIHNCLRDVQVVFNDSGTDTLKVGTSSNDDSLCDTGDTDLTAVALNTDVVSGAFPAVLAADTTFLIRYDGQNSDATTGEAIVYLEFTIMPVA